MTHPYRPAPSAPPAVPLWRRALCAMSLHIELIDAERGVFTCSFCGHEREPDSLRYEDIEVAFAQVRYEIGRGPRMVKP